ncbi:MAG: hypothetical protein QOE58_146, partial [Actinomycetota bacterium]|nr:hypothetical protein [Actinomycetota bacterium]
MKQPPTQRQRASPASASRTPSPRKPARKAALKSGSSGSSGGGSGRATGGFPPARQGVVHPERRVRFLLLVGLFVLSLCGAQLFRLQALDSSATATAALKTRLSIVTVPALRGNIAASNGVVLATSIERRNVFADQTAVPTYRKLVSGARATVGVAGAAADLAPLLKMSPAELSAKMTGTRRFEYLAKDISVSDWRRIGALGIPGIYSESTAKRFYPTSTAAG